VRARGDTLEKLVITGGKKLRGEIRISGAKNAALPILAATILANGESRITNLPELRDIETTKKLLRTLGATVEGSVPVLRIDASNINNVEAPYELVKTMRASVLVLGPLLARFGRARVSMPGGCAIGERPIDQHLKGLALLGAEIDLQNGYVEARAKRLKGAKIYLDMPTVTGTENLMMAAALADGVTILENAAREPEIEDLGDVLRKMGARVEGAGSEVITIEGVTELKPIEHAVIPDRIEAGTFMIAAAMTDGDVLLQGYPMAHLRAVGAKLTEAGVLIEETPEGVRIRRGKEIRAVNIITAPYPGFPTDMQAQFMSLMCVAAGVSSITETIFENRFMHVSELRRLGANIKTDNRHASIIGVSKLSGTQVMATDLRASACLVLAGLVAQGVTEVSRVYHLDRGYEKIERKLRSLGADIVRVEG
jgi:UDP-N-acetylglucosamine 1-carboxyvinyltransferase